MGKYSLFIVIYIHMYYYDGAYDKYIFIIWGMIEKC